MGDINLFPKRLVITPRDRIATIGIYNKSAATGDYDITVADMMMTPDGQLVPLDTVKDPAERAKVKGASQLLRWSPHRVELQGNEAQTIRIMARIPPNFPPGEYRSHFTVISEPMDDGQGLSIEEAAGQMKPGTLGVHIVPRFGISIPVILRVGETTLTTGLSDLAVKSLPGGHKAIAVTISRQGTRSAFGNIEVTAPGVKKPLALIKGIGVYTEVDARRIDIPVDPEADPAQLAPGRSLTVTYTDDDADPGKVLAAQQFTIP